MINISNRKSILAEVNLLPCFVSFRFKISDQEKASLAFNIRQRVFVDEQNVSHDEEYDSHEEEKLTLFVVGGRAAAGTARWRFTDKGIKLERFAVLPEFRNHGAGSFLVQNVLSDVVPYNKTIYLHSQVNAMNLYARAGFIPEGELFVEANIPHYKMIYSAEI